MNRFVQVVGIILVITIMMCYLVICIIEVQQYKGSWVQLNSSDRAACPQEYWNDTVKSGFALSAQWISPGGNIGNKLYNFCVKATNASYETEKLGN